MRSCLCFLLVAFSMLSSAQNTETTIDLNRIPQEKVRTLLENRITDSCSLQLYAIQPTFHKGQKMKGYHYLESVYLFREIPEKVWDIYQVTNPAESWNGTMISFGLLVSKSDKSIMYSDDKSFSGIDTGQVIFVNLKIMKGIYNLAVGLEIVDIDENRKSITYSYIKGGKSRGEQTIYFVPTKKGYTEIIHQTVFKGDSFIRDLYLYPWFHRIAINEFHRNMKRCLEQSNKLLAQREVIK